MGLGCLERLSKTVTRLLHLSV